jgi:hypothetical protein
VRCLPRTVDPVKQPKDVQVQRKVSLKSTSHALPRKWTGSRPSGQDGPGNKVMIDKLFQNVLSNPSLLNRRFRRGELGGER